MAVLVEILSVIIRRAAVERAFHGGWEGFRKSPAPNGTLCSDDDLIRIGFMALADANAYISTLEAGGLIFHRDGQAVDLALIHQNRGLALPAPWLEVGTLHLSGRPVVACWLAGRQPDKLSVPPGWKYEGSPSQHPCAEGVADGDRVKFLRSEDGVDVYLDLVSGKELFVGRPVIEGDTPEALVTQLQKLCHDALDLEAKSEPLKALGDQEGAVPIFEELQNRLLPEAERIGSGPGRNMAFAHFSCGLVLRILKRLPEAEAAFRKGNELQPGAINTLRELVRWLGEQGRHGEALPFAREAVEAEPTDAGAWGNLAMCFIQTGQRQEARKAIDHAIDLDPQDSLNRYIRDNFDSYFK